MGSLDIMNPAVAAKIQFHSSKKIAKPLKEMIIDQTDATENHSCKTLRQVCVNTRTNITKVAAQIRENLPPMKQRVMSF